MAKDVIPLPRSKSREHTRANFEAQAIRLSDDDVEKINGLNKDESVVSGVDAQGFMKRLDAKSSHY